MSDAFRSEVPALTEHLRRLEEELEATHLEVETIRRSRRQTALRLVGTALLVACAGVLSALVASLAWAPTLPEDSATPKDAASAVARALERDIGVCTADTSRKQQAIVACQRGIEAKRGIVSTVDVQGAPGRNDEARFDLQAALLNAHRCGEAPMHAKLTYAATGRFEEMAFAPTDTLSDAERTCYEKAFRATRLSLLPNERGPFVPASPHIIRVSMTRSADAGSR